MKKLRPIKRWGQNFLIDKNIVAKIIEIAGLGREDFVLEIGSGRGILTEEIVKRVKRVIAVEIDKKLCVLLKERLGKYKNVKIVQADFLKIELSSLHLMPHTKVIGNLPYYITTPIIMKLLQDRKDISSIVVMVQKEVAGRMTASAGSKNYGVLSIAVRYFADVSLAKNVSRKVFFPEPKVSSSIIKLNVLRRPRVKVKDENIFFKTVKAAFAQRRKMLVNSLSHSLNLDKKLIGQILEKNNVSPKRRAETLTLEEFGKLSDHISEVISLKTGGGIG